LELRITLARYLLVLFAFLLVPADAGAANRISAEQLMKEMRDGDAKLQEGSVVAGRLVLQDGVALRAEGAVFDGPVVAAPVSPDTPRPDTLGSLYLSGSHFKDSTAIAELSFDTLDCTNCTFDRDADFHSLYVKRMLLDWAVFKGAAGFIAMNLDGPLSLRDVRFEKTVSFAGASLEEFEGARLQAAQPIVISWSQFGNEWAARRRAFVFGLKSGNNRDAHAAQLREEFRFWRRNFEELGLEEDAREANYALVKLERREDFVVYKLNTYAPYVLALASGYGTDPYRPFWVAVGAIILFGFIFWPIGFQELGPNGRIIAVPGRYWLPFGMAFSVQTFVPFLKVSGMKEWELRRLWWLAPTESVIGVIVFGVAAYSAAVTL
jgi:hypothetical protein